MLMVKLMVFKNTILKNPCPGVFRLMRKYRTKLIIHLGFFQIAPYSPLSSSNPFLFLF